MKTKTMMNTTAAAPATRRAAALQPRVATSDARSGRKTSCPRTRAVVEWDNSLT